MRAFILIALLSFASAFALPAPSFAVEPVPNDDRETARVLDSIPFFDTVDTNGATTSPPDGSSCGIANDIWYKYPAPPVDTQLTYILYNVADEGGNLTDPITDPMVGFILADGNAQCGSAVMGQNIWGVVPAGVDAYIVVGHNESRGDPGVVQVGVFIAEPVNHYSLTVSPSGSVTGGAVTASGTVGCERSDAIYFIGRVKQKSGHGFITGETPLLVVSCDAPASPWSFTVAPTAGGKFVAGKATVTAEVICPVPAACAGARSEASVKVNVRK